MKKKRTLLLDYSYRVICIIGWKRAITLAVTDKADVLQEHLDEFVTATRTTYALPSVLRLKSRASKADRTIKFTRQNVYLRDGYTCQYCGERKNREDLTFDHVIPKSRCTQASKWDNIVTCCRNCNQRKANFTPEEAGMVLLTKPSKPRWLKLSMDISEPEFEEWKIYIGHDYDR